MSTPVTDGSRLIALLGSALAAYDMEGNEQWIQELDEPLAAGFPPVLAGDACIVLMGSRPYALAFDKRTGKSLWKAPLAEFSDYGSEDPDYAFSAPLLFRSRGREHVVVPSGRSIRVVAPWTGLSEGLGLSGPEIDFRQALVGSGLLLGYGPGTAAQAFRLSGAAGGSVTGPLYHWTKELLGGGISSALIASGRVFAIGMDGVARCFNSRTGREIDRQRLVPSSDASGGWCAPLRSGKRIYASHTSGRVFVISLERGLRLISTNSVGEHVHASPAASDGDLFLRTDAAIWCIAEDQGGSRRRQ